MAAHCACSCGQIRYTTPLVDYHGGGKVAEEPKELGHRKDHKAWETAPCLAVRGPLISQETSCMQLGNIPRFSWSAFDQYDAAVSLCARAKMALLSAYGWCVERTIVQRIEAPTPKRSPLMLLAPSRLLYRDSTTSFDPSILGMVACSRSNASYLERSLLKRSDHECRQYDRLSSQLVPRQPISRPEGAPSVGVQHHSQGTSRT